MPTSSSPSRDPASSPPPGALLSRTGPPLPSSRLLVFALIALAGATADLLTKHWIFRWRGLPGHRAPWWLIEDHVGIETAVNIGAVFGVGAGKGTLFAALSIVAGCGILIWLFWYRAAHQWWLTIALALVTGGIIGNLYDRLGLWWQPGYPEPWKSGVRDWILWQASDRLKWPNFNIADSLLVVGAGMLLWRSFFPATVGADFKPSRSQPSPAEADQAT